MCIYLDGETCGRFSNVSSTSERQCGAHIVTDGAIWCRTQTQGGNSDGGLRQVGTISSCVCLVPILGKRENCHPLKAASLFLKGVYVDRSTSSLKTRDLAPNAKVLGCPATTIHNHISGGWWHVQWRVAHHQWGGGWHMGGVDMFSGGQWHISGERV